MSMVEKVGAALKTWSFAKSPMLDGYRIVSGGEWKVFPSIAEASAALDTLNARAAILAMREASGGMVDAGARAPLFRHETRRNAIIIWTSMIDAALQPDDSGA